MSVVLVTAIGWVGGGLATLFLVWSLVYAGEKKEFDKKSIRLLIIGLIGVAVMVVAILLYFNATAVGEQKVKAWNAQSAGIQREIEVFSMTGEKIAEYSGVFNIEYDDNRVEIYDTKKGERIIIYYKNGTIIVTEPNTSQ